MGCARVVFVEDSERYLALDTRTRTGVLVQVRSSSRKSMQRSKQGSAVALTDEGMHEATGNLAEHGRGHLIECSAVGHLLAEPGRTPGPFRKEWESL